MKRMLYVVLVFLLLLPSAAYARDDHDDDDRHDKHEKHHYRMTDWQRVAADKARLAIQFGGSDKATSVTVPLKSLPSKGKNGSKITWVSSKPSVLSHNGKVLNRPTAADVTVTLKATIKYHKASATKWYVLTVKRKWSDAQKVAADKAALAIKFSGNDNASSVTVPLKPLPTRGAYGSKIIWYSSAPYILSHDGKTLNRPINGDITVVMTAIITNNRAADTKTFTLVVKQQMSYVQKVAADKAALAIQFGGNDTSNSVTVPLKSLPTKGAYGSNITWFSNAPNILSHDGRTLNRPTIGDVTVVMTAIIANSGAADTKTFVLTVKQQMSDEQKVAADKAALQIEFNGSDTASSVTLPLKSLAAKGAYGSRITWYSSAPFILSNDGKILNPPSTGNGDVTVIMTAIIVNNGAVDTKPFYLVVKQTMSDAQKVAADKAALTIHFGGNDSATSVTVPFKSLPTKGIYGSMITWISGAPSILSSDGKTLNRPSAGSGDATVIMTAIIANNGSADTKVFTLVVKQQLTDAQKVAADKAALTIEFNGSDSAASVTRPLKPLPATGLNGSTIFWFSSAPSILSNDGKTLRRPAAGTGDANVTLTAIITSNGVTELKSFSLIVKQY